MSSDTPAGTTADNTADTLAPRMPLVLPGRPGERAAHWRSSDLLGSAQEVAIEHGDTTYRLRLTLQGKLILTK